MSRSRDFDIAVEEMRKNRPTFTLDNREWTCRPALSFTTMAALEREYNDGDLTHVLHTFFEKVLIKADREPFRELITAEPDEDDDDAVPITLNQLSEIMKWLVSEYTGNPTQSAGPSSLGEPTTGPQLKAVSLDEVSATPGASVG